MHIILKVVEVVGSKKDICFFETYLGEFDSEKQPESGHPAVECECSGIRTCKEPWLSNKTSSNGVEVANIESS